MTPRQRPYRPPTSLSAIALVLGTALSGCLLGTGGTASTVTLQEAGFAAPSSIDAAPVPAESIAWPDFSGRTLDILDHGAFSAFATAASRFENLTGARVVHTEADDTGSALNRARADAGRPQFDVLYGIDNALLWQALAYDIFEPYTPVLAPRVAPAHLFFQDHLGVLAPWPATPVDHGYIAVNVDARHDDLGDGLTGLDDLLPHAHLFVTQDPRTSTPGLGFLLATVAAYGDDPDGWPAYWNDLLNGGAKVTSGWSEAYVIHFSGGYGVWEEGHIGDRAIVTSYTESPAYEAYYGAETVPAVVLGSVQRPAVFHQVQTMGILRGTPDLDLAQAWIEFTLTSDFQGLAAAENAVYPVDAAVSTDAVYGDIDPEPGTFPVVDLSWVTIGENLDRWLRQWTALCEAHGCRG